MRYKKLIDGEAIIYDYNKDSVCIKYISIGSKYWLRSNKYHNREGPAVESRNREKSYWINGKNYSYDEWKVKRNETL